MLWRLRLGLLPRMPVCMEICFIRHTVIRHNNKHSRRIPAIYSVVCVSNKFRSTSKVKLNNEKDRNGLSISIILKVNRKAINEMNTAWVKSSPNNCLSPLPVALRMPNSCERFR